MKRSISVLQFISGLVMCTMRSFRYLIILAVLLSACDTTSTSTPSHQTISTVQPTETPLPTVTQTPRPISLHACVTANSTIRVRKGPGTNYEAIDGLASNACMSVLGRNQDSSWVYMASEDNKKGWVAARLLTINGDLNQVSVQTDEEIVRLAPTAKVIPTRKVVPTEKLPPTKTPASLILIPLCSETTVGQQVSCKIERAYCDYFPAVDGSPTFCDDKPYPNHHFQLVVFGADWSALDGECIIVTGVVSIYNGKLQIQAVSRSQVSYCE